MSIIGASFSSRPMLVRQFLSKKFFYKDERVLNVRKRNRVQFNSYILILINVYEETIKDMGDMCLVDKTITCEVKEPEPAGGSA